MELTPLELAMKSRVRRHMLTSIGGIFVGILLASLAGALAVKFFGSPLPRWVAVFPILGVLTIPIVGFWSTRRNLRCPACEKSVVYQVSAMYSAFGARVDKHCPHCGQKIFADNIPRNFKRMLLIMMGVAFSLGLIGAIAAALTHP